MLSELATTRAVSKDGLRGAAVQLPSGPIVMKYLVTTKWTLDLANAVEDLCKKYGYPDPNPEIVKTDKDWRCVSELMELCGKYFPKEIREHIEIAKALKANQSSEFGYMQDSSTRKGGQIQMRQTGVWPFEFEILVKVIWPKQKFNKKFTREFFKRFPVLQTAERI